MASDTIDTIDWSRPLPAWAVPPERFVRSTNGCSLSRESTLKPSTCDSTTLLLRPFRVWVQNVQRILNRSNNESCHLTLPHWSKPLSVSYPATSHCLTAPSLCPSVILQPHAASLHQACVRQVPCHLTLPHCAKPLSGKYPATSHCLSAPSPCPSGILSSTLPHCTKPVSDTIKVSDTVLGLPTLLSDTIVRHYCPTLL